MIDPRPDPTGSWVAYAADGGLHVVRTDGAETRARSARRTRTEVTLGRGRVRRRRGDGPLPRLLVVARRRDGAGRPGRRRPGADAGTSPTRPTRRPQPAELRYPVAGSADADVTLHLLGLDGSPHRRHLGPRGLPLPRRTSPGPTGRRSSCRSCRATSARAQVLCGRPGDRRRPRRCSSSTTTIWLDVGARRAGPAARRPAGRHRRRRRRPPARASTARPVDRPDAAGRARSSSVDDDGVAASLGTDDPAEQPPVALVRRTAASSG